jgi:hypothetical protein
MCRKSFKTVNYIDCKIIAFEMKKRGFFIPYKTRSANFESSWLKMLALHKIEAFHIVLEN